MADLVSGIAVASSEQSTGLEQINKALTQMDEVTQQNSALVEENAATAKTLEQQAMAMDERIAFFRLNEANAGGASRAAQGTAHADTLTDLPGHAAPPLAPAPKAVARAGAPRANPVRRMQTALAEAWEDF